MKRRQNHFSSPRPAVWTRRLCFAWLAFFLPFALRADSVVVFNEIMYHPATNEPAREWVELHNQMSIDVDISGWSITNGIGFIFPEGTVVRGGGWLVVAISPAALAVTAGVTNALGPFTGRLSNSGEKLELRDLNGRLMDAVSYGTTGDWPSAPDGAGVSLAKRHPNLASAPAESWIASAQFGGTPGAANFDPASPPPPFPGTSNIVSLHDEIVINELMYHHRPIDPVPPLVTNHFLVPITATWRYDDTGVDRSATWREPDFDDSAWPSGPAAFHAEAATLTIAKNTALAPGRGTYYFRTSFNFNGDTNGLAISLRVVADDGAVVWLNGLEVARVNMPDGPVTHSTPARFNIAEAGYAGPFALSLTNLVTGLNVLAVEVHQTAPAPASTGIALNGGGLALAEEGPFSGPVPMNLTRAPGATPLALNSLLGFAIHSISNLTDGGYGYFNSWVGQSGSPAFAGVVFDGSHSISNIAFGRDNLGAYTDRTLGLYTLQYTTVASPGTGTPFTGVPTTGWATIGTLDLQTNGTGNFTFPSRRHRFTFDPVTATAVRLVVPAAGLANGTCIDELEVNAPDTSGDVVFAAELTAMKTLSAGSAFAESPESWVELYNRSTNAVDLSGWRLDDGIRHRFTNGTMLAPDSYLVVASDPTALLAKFPGIAVQGPFTNRLSHRSDRLVLRDAANAVADSVRYFDGGHWPAFADGGGSSLELIDARADNSKAGSWAASDESGRAAWHTFTYCGVAMDDLGPTLWREFALGLLDAGELLLDEVSVIDSPDGAAAQLIVNGSFESGLAGWRILGNHKGEVIADPDNAANHVLRLRATGSTDDQHNHVETTLAGGSSVANGREYEISFRARWIAGNNQLNTRLYHNRVARTTRLPAPDANGTPGARNSRWATNAGPTLDRLQHVPVVPSVGEAVTVSIEISDPDSVTNTTLWWCANGGAWTSTAMVSTNGSFYTAMISGQPAAAIVQFFVSATDGLGTAVVFPSGGTNSRALFKVNDGLANLAVAHNVRILMTAADTDFLLDPTNLMSNDALPCTVLYDEQETFYDAGVRLRGSMRGRASVSSAGFEIEFQPDHLFRGVQRSITLDRSGGAAFNRTYGQEEILVRHIINRAGGLQARYDDLARCLGPRNGYTSPCLLSMARYGNDALDAQFSNGSDGTLYEFDRIYFAQATADGTPEGLKTPFLYLHPAVSPDITNLGDNAEAYRWHFLVKNNRERDDAAALVELCRSFDLSGTALDAATQARMDLAEWLRAFAVMSLCGIGDAYTRGANHNLGLYFRPADGRALALPWDWDFAFVQPTNAPLWGDMNLAKIIALPANEHAFKCHLLDLINTIFNTNQLGAWADHYDNFLPTTGPYPAQSFSSLVPRIAGRASWVLGQLGSPTPFAIAGGGQTGLTNSAFAAVTGAAWFDAKEIRLTGATGALALVWTSPTNWQAAVPLLLGTNALTFIAYDARGHAVGTSVVSITSSALAGAPDADGDGMPDTWELAHGLNPALNDANADNDGDGLTNYQEYLTGTDPNDAQSFLRLDAAADGLNLRLSFTALAGRNYTLLQRDSLTAGSWSHLADFDMRATNRVEEVLVAPVLSGQQRVYRLTTP
jgi:hypothetical protein